MAIKAATRDSPATRPEAIGTLNNSWFFSLNFAHAHEIVAPMVKANALLKNTTQPRPSPIAEGSQGHAYLGHLVPWIMLAAGFGAGALLGRVSSAWRAPSRAVPAPVSFLRLWLLTALVLIGIYVGQELLEGWLATGHPVGVAGVLGAGGWTALPAATAVGLLLAGILFVAELLVERLAAGHVPAVRRPAALALRRIAVHLAAPGPMASAAPGRAPPATA
jgi:hypothetical protein